MRKEWIAIGAIRFAKKKRRGVSPVRVEELRREIEGGLDMTPIRVNALGDGTYVVRDGRHRIEAHIAAGISHILALVENLWERMRKAFRRTPHRLCGVFSFRQKNTYRFG